MFFKDPLGLTLNPLVEGKFIVPCPKFEIIGGLK
jgi:hypothetical protein